MMNDKNVNFVCYAGNVLINNSEEDLQRLLHQFKISTQKFIMEIFIDKIKCIVTN